LGDKPCVHPSFEKEYYLGADTMDFVCSSCGAEFTRNEKEKIEEDRKKNAL
jgi:uncharacterized Zn ribbon protein